MKVIVAGYAKTGTKSVNLALTELGYNVYDFLENLQYLEQDWKEILELGTGCVADFKRMYEGIDVVIDGPAFLFWEEIHQAFPDSKIIVTTRDIDDWYKSWIGQTANYNKSWFLHFAMLLTPKGWKYFAHIKRIGAMRGVMLVNGLYYEGKGFAVLSEKSSLIFGDKVRAPFLSYCRNEMLSKLLFRRHYSYVIQKAPKDKLLVYNVKEGWEPLCRFLRKEVPDKPFPHVNVGGKLTKYLNTHPYMQEMKKELFAAVGVLVAVVTVASYTAYKRWYYV